MDCADAIERSTGKKHSTEEITEFITAADKIRTRINLDNGIASKEKAIFEALDEFNEEMVIAAKIEKRNAMINQRRQLEAIDFIENAFVGDEGRGIQAMIAGDNGVAIGSRLSVDAEQKATRSQYIGGLVADLQKEGVYKLAQSAELDRAVARAMYGAKSPDPDVQKIADIFMKWQELARREANEAGAWIPKNPNYITRQAHDADKIAKASEAEWREVIEPRLADKTFEGIENKDDFFASLYLALSTGIHLTDTPKQLTAAFKGNANLAKKMSQGRLLHFKDSDAWMDYNDVFGTGGVTESILRGLDSSAGSTALMRKLGTNPNSMIDTIYDKLMRKTKDRKKLADSRNYTDNLMAVVTGETMQAGNQMFASRMSAIRAVLSMAKLGGALLSSIGADNVAYAAEVRYQGDSMFSGLAESMKAVFGGRGTIQQREQAANLGVAMDSFIGTLSSRFNVNDPQAGLSQKAMTLFFRANGLSWWTDSLKVSAAIGTSNRLYQLKDLPYDKLDPRVQRVTKLYGITGPEWNIIKKGYEVGDDGVGLLTPEAQKSIPDSDYIELLEAQGITATKAAIRDARSEMERKLRNYVSDRQAYAVLESDTRSQATWTQGTKRGTVPGELLRSMAQFKQFPTIFMQRVIGREIKGKLKGTAEDKFLDSPVYGVASLMSALTIAGYMSMSAKDMAKGREPRQFNDDPANNAKIMAAAMIQGGGLGIYGDFIFGDMSRFGGGPVDTLAGPTVGTAADIIKLWQKAKNGDDPSASALSLVLNNTPGLNLFYSRIALDYMFLYDIRESLNPGYLRRMERRIKKQNNQDFMYPPSRHAAKPFTGN